MHVRSHLTPLCAPDLTVRQRDLEYETGGQPHDTVEIMAEGGDNACVHRDPTSPNQLEKSRSKSSGLKVFAVKKRSSFAHSQIPFITCSAVVKWRDPKTSEK